MDINYKRMLKTPRRTAELGEGVLEPKILEQSAQMEKYSQMVESIEGNNKEVFREIYSVLDSHQIRQPIRQLHGKTSDKF